MPTWTARRLTGFWFAVFFIAPILVTAADITISARVIDTSGSTPVNPIVQFTGIAAPGATVVITRATQPVGQQTASVQGKFDITVSNQPTGQQTFTVTATDDASRPLAPLSFALNLQTGTTTIITGIFLGPSIAIDKNAVKIGQFVTISGTTAPNSAVTLTVQSDQKNYSVTANSAGDWSKMVNTEEVGIGTHSAQAQSRVNGSQISAASSSISFAVNPLEQCDGKKTADLNCDGLVNITDFSILLFFWQQTNPRNARSDINADGRVTIVDFSIMLFQWTG